MRKYLSKLHRMFLANRLKYQAALEGDPDAASHYSKIAERYRFAVYRPDRYGPR